MTATTLNDHDLPVMTTMPATVHVPELGPRAIVMIATAFDHDLLGAGDRRSRNANRGNRRGNESKLLHNFSLHQLSGNRTSRTGWCSTTPTEKILNGRSGCAT